MPIYYLARYLALSEWDPKITTPPGLYLFTTAILTPLSKVSTLNIFELACFRLVNIIFTIGTLFVIHRILQIHHQNDEPRIVLLSAFNITIFPLLYFFNFLYYTDCGSTFFVLLMYYWHLKKFYFLASIIGAVSLLFRQTNIVWMFYVAAEATLPALLELFKERLAKKDKDPNDVSLSHLKTSMLIVKKNWMQILKKVFEINLGYIPVAIASVIFVLYNGSIALGDKKAHEVCLNIPQLFYFLLFTLFFASPYLISLTKVKKFLIFVLANKILVFEIVATASFAVVFMSHVHPYLLADNRHFTFYIWRKILGRNLFLSLALIPFYIYSGFALLISFEHKSIVFKSIVVFCIIISVIPQKLLEFRYFIIPYIMLRINLKVESKWQPFLEFALYFVINFLVLYLFLFQKLPWEKTEKSVRIMW
ncbi:putative Dol-P-Glc:Glc(2)Man(9)GlcNAc(2)-PP-Dol alpha-1,2-glucosyltransferase isoform X2 [Argiope bruennichi]|uniref:putative Dol-P-Glc:Glc(2)Man(9)GlcNAc(2)-PP-Dol alpha-1,2-glucosyltransferase isoform X2 n=1 Tax=Argiope bruennichi TaxID=94029 RepID=UPI002493DD4D|nr:putative Dol-P-Glc:Glc(2)Man(9)GlcNAc(2)-PP-Dol alpha-1,2-glucosyltransferase isoform X2 [Argiope bruennichi]